MTLLWSICSMNYYTISFYIKYIPGDIFFLSYASGISDTMFYLLTAFFMSCIGFKPSYIMGFFVAFTGAMGLITINSPSFAPIFVFICKAGICIGFTLCYSVNHLVFPSSIAASCLGACNMVARVATIFAPLVAEMGGTRPM